MNTLNLQKKGAGKGANVRCRNSPSPNLITSHLTKFSPHHNITTQPHQHITITTTALLFSVAGAVFGDVAVSLVVSGTACIW